MQCADRRYPGRRSGRRAVAPPSGAITKRGSADAKAGNPWERRGSMSGINKAAQRKADALVDSAGGLKATDGNVDGNDVSTKKNGLRCPPHVSLHGLVSN